ncbi:unnamed protein product, partial [Didymodactylos carnosus]
LSRHLSLNSDSSKDTIHSQKRIITHYVYSKLEEYATKSSHLWILTSTEHIRKRLLRRTKDLSTHHSIPEHLVRQWILETLDSIDLTIQHLKTMTNSRGEFIQILSGNKTNEQLKRNKWRKLQLNRAKEIIKQKKDDDELLYEYRQYIRNKFTPKHETKSSFRHDTFNIDEEYKKAESISKQYLISLLTDFNKRTKPNLHLLEEMIDLGLKQMLKRPKLGEFEAVTKTEHNILAKAALIYKMKKAYEMNLRNQADDFMLLRFGQILTNSNKNKTVSETFMQYIHMFLNSVSLLAQYMKDVNDNNNIASDEYENISSYLAPTDNSSATIIMSPDTYIDQWTWLLEKWKEALCTFPIYLTESGSFSRLLRTTIGIGIARLYGFAENNENIAELDVKFFQALQMGYYYGIAYAFVDGLQDEREKEEQDSSMTLLAYSDVDKWLAIMEDVLCGGSFDRTQLPKLSVTDIVLETFDCLITLTNQNHITNDTFNDLALLLHSQRSDIKESDNFYFDPELYLGSMMKSHFTYTATAFMGGAHSVHNRERLWIMPFLGQMTDDCRDFYDDLKSGSVTSFTHYYQQKQKCLEQKSLNPFY